MPKPVARLEINQRPRTDEERAEIQHKVAALNLIARKAGFPSYQRMVVHICDRLVAVVGDEVIDAYPAIDGEIRSIATRAVAGLAAMPRRPK